jgi:hypothetical protein
MRHVGGALYLGAYMCHLPLEGKKLQQAVRMTGERVSGKILHCMRSRVVSESENASMRYIFGQESIRPECLILVPPCILSMSVEAVNEHETITISAIGLHIDAACRLTLQLDQRRIPIPRCHGAHCQQKIASYWSQQRSTAVRRQLRLVPRPWG